MAKLLPVRMLVPIVDSRRQPVPAGGVAWLHLGAARAVVGRKDGTEFTEPISPGPVIEESYVQPPTGSTRPDPTNLRARRLTTAVGAGRETTDAGRRLEERLPQAPVDLGKLSRNEALKVIRECENATLLAKWHADLGEDRPAGYTVYMRAIEDRHAELKQATAAEE